MPDVVMPTTGPSALPSNSWVMARKSVHHTPSASCSTCPGLGIEVRWAFSAVAMTLPFNRASTPLLLPVPKSIPMTNLLSFAMLCSFLRATLLSGEDGVCASIPLEERYWMAVRYGRGFDVRSEKLRVASPTFGDSCEKASQEQRRP